MDINNKKSIIWISRDEVCEILRTSYTQLITRRDADTSFPETKTIISSHNNKKSIYYNKEEIIIYGRKITYQGSHIELEAMD